MQIVIIMSAKTFQGVYHFKLMIHHDSSILTSKHFFNRKKYKIQFENYI